MFGMLVHEIDMVILIYLVAEVTTSVCHTFYIQHHFFIYLLFDYYFVSNRYLFYNGAWQKVSKRFKYDCYHMMSEIDELINELGEEGYNIAFDFWGRLNVSRDEE